MGSLLLGTTNHTVKFYRYFCKVAAFRGSLFSELHGESNTRKSGSSDIQTPRSGLGKRGVAVSLWIPDETVLGLFDTASEAIENFWRNSKHKFTKFYGN